MRKVRLGKSELMVSRVGFGGIPITRVSSQEAEDCIRSAIDLGVNFIDTATGYHDSEEKIGRAIKGRRENLVIATKSPASTPERMSECIDQSLRRLKVDWIDLYQFHLIKDDEGLKKATDLIPTLERARDQGKIHHIGATVHGVDYINKVLTVEAFETVMIALNFIVCEAAETALPDAHSRDVGVIAMKPLAGGHIEDAYLAFKYFIGMNDVVPVVGIESADQMEQIVNIVEKDIPATREELNRMKVIRSESGTRFCRRCGYCMPCEHGVQIIPITIFKSFIKRLPPESLVNEQWASIMQSLESCVQCGECEKKCPYNLDIQGILKENKSCYNELCEEFNKS